MILNTTEILSKIFKNPVDDLDLFKDLSVIGILQ